MRLAGLALAAILAPRVAAAELPASAGAAAMPVPPAEGVDAVKAERARVQELRRQAEAERRLAEERYKAEQAACQGRFFVGGCLEDARKARSAAIVASRKPEAEARAIERRLRQQEADDDAARRAEEEPRRERERLEQAVRNQAEQDEAMRRSARKQAEKARRTGED